MGTTVEDRELTGCLRSQLALADTRFPQLHCGTDAVRVSLTFMAHRPYRRIFLVLLLFWQVASGAVLHTVAASDVAPSMGHGRLVHCAPRSDTAPPMTNGALFGHVQRTMPTSGGPSHAHCCLFSACLSDCGSGAAFLPTFETPTAVWSGHFTRRASAPSTLDNRVFDFFRPPI